MDTYTFECSICGDKSHQICVYCTKDACNNHLCHRCMCCSECCRCDMPTTAVQLPDVLGEPEEETTKIDEEPTPLLT